MIKINKYARLGQPSSEYIRPFEMMKAWLPSLTMSGIWSNVAVPELYMHKDSPSYQTVYLTSSMTRKGFRKFVFHMGQELVEGVVGKSPTIIIIGDAWESTARRAVPYDNNLNEVNKGETLRALEVAYIETLNELERRTAARATAKRFMEIKNGFVACQEFKHEGPHVEKFINEMRVMADTNGLKTSAANMSKAEAEIWDTWFDNYLARWKAEQSDPVSEKEYVELPPEGPPPRSEAREAPPKPDVSYFGGTGLPDLPRGNNVVVLKKNDNGEYAPTQAYYALNPFGDSEVVVREVTQQEAQSVGVKLGEHLELNRNRVDDEDWLEDGIEWLTHAQDLSGTKWDWSIVSQAAVSYLSHAPIPVDVGTQLILVAQKITELASQAQEGSVHEHFGDLFLKYHHIMQEYNTILCNPHDEASGYPYIGSDQLVMCGPPPFVVICKDCDKLLAKQLDKDPKNYLIQPEEQDIHFGPSEEPVPEVKQAGPDRWSSWEACNTVVVERACSVSSSIDRYVAEADLPFLTKHKMFYHGPTETRIDCRIMKREANEPGQDIYRISWALACPAEAPHESTSIMGPVTKGVLFFAYTSRSPQVIIPVSEGYNWPSILTYVIKKAVDAQLWPDLRSERRHDDRVKFWANEKLLGQLRDWVTQLEDYAQVLRDNDQPGSLELVN